jgi:hypothetical protein
MLAFDDQQLRDWYSYGIGWHWPCVSLNRRKERPVSFDGIMGASLSAVLLVTIVFAVVIALA